MTAFLKTTVTEVSDIAWELSDALDGYAGGEAVAIIFPASRGSHAISFMLAKDSNRLLSCSAAVIRARDEVKKNPDCKRAKAALERARWSLFGAVYEMEHIE